MINGWSYQKIPFNFMLSDKVLFSVVNGLQVRSIGLDEEVPPVAMPLPPVDAPASGSQGFLVRSLPVSVQQPVVRKVGKYWCYVPAQYMRYYIDLRQSFSDYKHKFSSKTRSTLGRKIKKYAEHCGGTISWKSYKTRDEVRAFFALARQVSVNTYQEKLLDAGLPDTEGFVSSMEVLASEGRVRAYILFDGDRPVSYLYCPIHNGVLLYQYLGYLPEYGKWSVGTLLQWFALEEIFGEGKFKLFDFTEGQSEHKRFFGTHSVQCANVYFLKRSLRNILLISAHRLINACSEWIGYCLEQYGVKSKIKKLIRFGQ